MASLLEPQPPVDPMQETLMWAKDTTLSVSAMNLVGGYVMGGAFSLFGSMISAEAAAQCMGTGDFFRYSMRNAHRMGANFGYFGFLFGGIEVALEKRRGKKDVWNPTIAGGIIGGGMDGGRISIRVWSAASFWAARSPSCLSALWTVSGSPSTDLGNWRCIYFCGVVRSVLWRGFW